MVINTAIESIRVHKRIIGFYGALNRKDWDACFEYLDPKLRKTRVEHKDYIESLSSFFETYGPIQIESVEKLDLHFHDKCKVYEDRPFALAIVRWKDNREQRHAFRESWVKFRTTWYSRKIGLA